MQNQLRYHPRFADQALQRLADEWRVRVLTPQDIESLVNHGFVSPVSLVTFIQIVTMKGMMKVFMKVSMGSRTTQEWQPGQNKAKCLTMMVLTPITYDVGKYALPVNVLALSAPA